MSESTRVSIFLLSWFFGYFLTCWMLSKRILNREQMIDAAIYSVFAWPLVLLVTLGLKVIGYNSEEK